MRALLELAQLGARFLGERKRLREAAQDLDAAPGGAQLGALLSGDVLRSVLFHRSDLDFADAARARPVRVVAALERGIAVGAEPIVEQGARPGVADLDARRAMRAARPVACDRLIAHVNRHDALEPM